MPLFILNIRKEGFCPMITKTLNLDDAYTRLFDEIREKSSGAIDINNVEGFFGNIIEISALNNGEGKKYLRLPLDEPMFEIDANTRKIDVPNEFKSNGLSVQGDHLAETVYFVIDRYFDYMDLNNTNVTINWKMGAETGKTKKFTMSTDVIPGSIVFGWPIDNIITQKSGTLTFAVEFNRKDNGEEGNVLYDFNTLPATVNIKDGLVVGDITPVGLDNDILAALANSSFGEGDAAVGDVVWVSGNGHGLVRNLASNDEFLADEYVNELNLSTNVVSGVPSSIPIYLYAQGFVDNVSEVKYISMAGEEVEIAFLKPQRELIPAGDSLDANIKYFLEDGSLADENSSGRLFMSAPLSSEIKYYVSAGDANPPAYNLASDEQIAAWGTNNEVELFVKLAKIPVSESGSYAVKAQGQKWNADHSVKIGAGVTVTSDIVIVPKVQVPSKINVVTSPLEQLEEGYSFDPSINNVVFLGENGGTLTASAEVDNFGALQFTWQQKLGELTEFSNVSESEAEYKIINEDVFEVEEAGEYKVLVKNFMNGKETEEAVSSDTIIASPLAGKITEAKAFAAVGNGEFSEVNGLVRYNSEAGQQKGKVTLKIDNIAISGAEGEISYEWYLETGTGEDLNLTLVHTGNNFIIDNGDGSFVPVIKNNYNGSIFTYKLDTINVDDDPRN